MPALGAALGLGLVLTGCGRSAPPDALGDPSADPSIAGVSITSPDAVVSTAPGALAPATTITGAAGSTTTPLSQPPAVVGPAGNTPAALSPAAAGATAYVVEDGDTLSGIASKFGISTRSVAAANGISDPNTLKPGQQLMIPAPPASVPVTVEQVTPTTRPQ
ncbi:MAG: LysM peptidoglycan-binding domain-containing protein [Acidimicrobiales bacterium]